MTKPAGFTTTRTVGSHDGAEPNVPIVQGNAANSIGMLLHRALYRALALLPRRTRHKVVGRWFDALFAIAPDPWHYATSRFEMSKRQKLTGAVPAGAEVIVEFGCADGHNLLQLAAAHPDAQLIGIDISRRALALANTKLIVHGNVELFCTADPSGWDNLGAKCQRIDVLILSEVLYYLGTARTIEQSLLPLALFLNQGSLVVMLHGGGDASALHSSAARALGIQIQSERSYQHEGHQYKIAWARAHTEFSNWGCHGS